MKDTCVNCGKEYISYVERFMYYLKTTGIIFTGKLEECCENPKKATKNDIVLKILNDL